MRVYYDNADRHQLPHVHAYYGERDAAVGVDGELLAGTLPVKQLRMVQAWLAIHEDEVREAWAKALRHEPPGQIQPLR
ncbi:MAG: DUF4160 domain-containing protein [Bifidobacteriaceae bacterium]|nr:DUF4160 domain-containing protein [Bifidobacteriaceae bacterium]